MSRRAVFLDRDGVINEPAAPGEYIRTWREFKTIEAAIDWIRLFNALGLLVIVVTNQRGVALGRMSCEQVEEIHANMRSVLAECGARIDDVFFCPHGDDECDCRKPKPGMVLKAAAKWDIDLGASLMIGDGERDRELARACGMRFVKVAGGRIERIEF